MSDLRFAEYLMPAAELGAPDAMAPLYCHGGYQPDRAMVVAEMGEEDARYVGYGAWSGCLPYFVQRNYTRTRSPRSFRAAVLENEFLRAVFLPDLGGRLWSLTYKPENRELLYVNPVFQPANLAIRDAWFSGGVEWNFGWNGHTPFTCSPLFVARTELGDGTPVLRMYEWERLRCMAYQMDFFLPDGSRTLFTRVRLVNPHGETTPVYWWSNIAVPEKAGARVVVPADAAYCHDYVKFVSRTDFPRIGGQDMSYPLNCPRARDFFFLVRRGQYPWIAWADETGRGMFQSSTLLLAGRKMFVWGTSMGGARRQELLGPPGSRYLEIQAGLARTQWECLPMPAGAEWEWLETYGPLETAPSVAHADDWADAVAGTARAVEAVVPLADLERRLSESREMALSPPAEVIQRGAGWAALEERRRRKAGEPSAMPGSLVFSDADMTEEQAPWLELLDSGAMSEHAPTNQPASWMIQREWRAMLEESVQDGRSDHWLGRLHLGIMRFAAGEIEDAREAWDESLLSRQNAWAARNLGALARLEGDHEKAARFYLTARALAPDLRGLLIECAYALIGAGMARKWIEIADSLPERLRGIGRIRVLTASAAVEIGDLDRVSALLAEDLLVEDLREGDNQVTDLWFRYQEERLARKEGVAVTDSLRERVRREFPPPRHLEFRSSGK